MPNTMTWKGAWVGDGSNLSVFAYIKDDAVKYNGIVYVSTSNNIPIGSPSPDSDMSNWDVVVIDGSSGNAGSNGTSGNSGSSGTSGEAGVSGTSGTSGENGASGTSGTSGGTGDAGQGLALFTLVDNSSGNLIFPTNNSIEKSGSGSGASRATTSESWPYNASFVSGRVNVHVSNDMIIGLSTNGTSYTYGLSFQGGNVYVYYNNSFGASVTTYTTNDFFEIVAQSSGVYMYKNGVQIYTNSLIVGTAALRGIFVIYTQDDVIDQIAAGYVREGLSGTSGSSGSSGTSGEVGSSGTSGQNGSSGSTGTSGSSASSGSSGTAGSSGSTGTSGNSGTSGSSGTAGSSGSTGTSGSTGSSGSSGMTGTSGTSGAFTGTLTFTQGTDIPSAASINDYNISAGSLFSITGTTSSSITGFANGVIGRYMLIVNNTDKNQTFQQENTGSLASNRLVLGVSNKTIGINQTATFIYVGGLTIGASTNQSRWILTATT